MARRQTGQDEIDILKLQQVEAYLTIPNLAILFVILIGLTYAIASITGGIEPLIGSDHALQTPIMMLIYAALILVLYSIISLAGNVSIVTIFKNPAVIIALIIVWMGISWLGNNTDVLATMFSII